MSRVLMNVGVVVLVVIGGMALLMLGNGRYETTPVHFSTFQQTILVNRGPASSRVALVIGIDHYRNLGKDQQLERAKSDARAVAAKLEAMGYDTILDTDATRAKIYADLDRAVARIKPGGAAFFYFAGHGISDTAANYLDGANYLVPSDAPSPDKHTQSAFEYSSVPLLSILEQFRRSGARISVAILDACRDSPFQGKSAADQASKAQTDPSSGGSRGDFYVIYSASPGQTALDRLPESDGDPNSVFTRVLVKNLSDGARLEDLTRTLQSSVSALSGGAQQPIAYRGTDDRLTLSGDVVPEDRDIAVKVDAKTAAATEKSPIARDAQMSVDMARTAEADAREWEQSAKVSESKAKIRAREAEDAGIRSRKRLPGYGSKVLDDGAIYQGQLADGEPNGVGVANLPGAYTYRGEWVARQKAGFGLYESLKLHYTYAGEWHDNKKDGAGVYRLANGEVYRGEWHYGKPDGFGVISGSAKDSWLEHVGQFNDQDASYSVVYDRTGTVTYGLTKHGKLEGPAAKLDRAGHVIEQGYYEDDVRKPGM